MKRIDLIQKSGIYKIFKPFFSGLGHILVFHRVSDQIDSNYHKNLAVSQTYLDNVLSYFRTRNIDIVSLDECYNRMTGQGSRKRFVSFTFDDGYFDNMSNALPIFEKYDAPFALFLTTGYIDSTTFFWGYILEELVQKKEEITFNSGSDEVTYITRTVSEKSDAFYKIKKHLRNCSSEAIRSIFEEILGSNSDVLINKAKSLMLSWEQVISLSNHHLVTLGAHTVNHPVLSKLSETEVKSEICESVKQIEGKTGKQVSYFAYPFGGDNEAGDREYKIVKDIKFKMAFTAKNGNIFGHHKGKLLALPRISLNDNWSNSHIDLFINGFTPFVNKLR